MSRKITMPKCPYCGKEKEYRIGDYDTSKLVSMATGTGDSDITIRCMECGKDYKVSCNIRYYGRKRGINMADIELVIKIPEELLSEIDDENYQSTISWYDTTLYCAIKDGTPLPKGHGRLIDADALNRKDVNCANVPMNFIDTASTIIEADKTESEE